MIPQDLRHILKSLNVIYLDRGLIALNKPPGLICQGTSAENARGTIQSLIQGLTLLNHNQNVFTEPLTDLRAVLVSQEPIFPLHRLDKLTTGTLILARGQHNARNFARQFASRQIKKEYLALVRADSRLFINQKSGSIDADLFITEGRVSATVSQPPGNQESTKTALTEWELLAVSPNSPLALLRLRLITGVKHQLRVHLADILQAPVLGDRNHNSRIAPKLVLPAVKTNEHLFLHASKTCLMRYCKRMTAEQRLPIKGRQFELGISAPLPSYFLNACAAAHMTVPPLAQVGGLTVDGHDFVDTIQSLQGEWL